MEKYVKPFIANKLQLKGIIPFAVAEVAAAAGAVAFATAVSGDDDFYPEHMRSLTDRKALNASAM